MSKLRSFRRDNHASIFQDIQPSPTPSPPVSSPSPPPPTSTKDSAENPTVTTLASSSPELMTKENFGDESFVEPTFKKHRLGSLSNEDESTSSLNSHDEGNNTNQVLRKRQRLLSNDTIMADDPASTIDEVPVSPPRLLLGSPDLIESNNGLRWLITERRSIQAIKTGTAVLKVLPNDSILKAFLIIYLIDCLMYILLFALFYKT